MASSSGSDPKVSKRCELVGTSPSPKGFRFDKDALVSSPDADITLRSSDGVLLKFYKKQLEVHSKAFAGAEGYTLLAQDVVDLEETCNVLEILLQLMSLEKPPTIGLLDFSILNPLAEAVEKYEVFSAMEACELAMRYVYSHGKEAIRNLIYNS